MNDVRRTLPSVGTLLESASVRALLDRAPRAVVTDAVRDAIDAARRDPSRAPTDDTGWTALISAALAARERPSLRPVFNATGVVLHTNLGRAPLAAAAIDAIGDVAAGFTNLEYDLEIGGRGSRYVHCVALLRELTGAEDAIVVNNCAGALVLALAALARGRESVISRGELIEIGGSFRVPEIMEAAGTTLVEVGTTNRTNLDDYRRVIGPRTAALVKVHRSNFTVNGFVAEVGARELAALAAEKGLAVIEDFGSGLMLSLEPYGLSGEPTAPEVVRGGASLVLMSGDKLLGGPQAGIILGTAVSVGMLRKHPLARALRVDKLTLAALGATLALYRDPSRAVREIPVLAMLTQSAAEIRARVDRVAAALAARGIDCTLVAAESTVGGGAFPAARLATSAIAVVGDAATQERRLRLASVPVIGRIADDRLLLDLRSVPATQDDAFISAVAHALG